jgi:hypothetical protein
MKSSKFESKYKEIDKLMREMTQFVEHSRPNCDEILDKKSLWALRLEELTDELEILVKNKLPDIKDNFKLFFILTKSRFDISRSWLKLNKWTVSK